MLEPDTGGEATTDMHACKRIPHYIVHGDSALLLLVIGELMSNHNT